MEEFDFTLLPSLVLIKILRLLSPSFSDVRNLSYVNKIVRQNVLEYMDLIYTCHVHLDNSVKKMNIDLKRPVLSLKLSCSTGFDAKEGAELQAYFLTLIGKMDLSCLKSLEIRNLNVKNRKAFKGLLQILPLNPHIMCNINLEYLSIDVSLINLSEIRNSVVLYRYDDINSGVTNVDYIVNSAVSQVLYSFLTFVDQLYSPCNLDKYDPYGRCHLKQLEINFLSEEDSDWNDLDPANFSHLETTQLRDCLSFMINEFKERVVLSEGIIEKIVAKGIPILFYNFVKDLTSEVLSTSTKSWLSRDSSQQPFILKDVLSVDKFDISIYFNNISDSVNIRSNC